MKKYIHVVCHNSKTGKTKEHKFKLSEFNLVSKLLEENIWLQIEKREMTNNDYNLTFGMI